MKLFAIALSVLTAVSSLLPFTNVAEAGRVRGYYRKNGTYVRPHYRSNPSSGGGVYKIYNYNNPIPAYRSIPDSYISPNYSDPTAPNYIDPTLPDEPDSFAPNNDSITQKTTVNLVDQEYIDSLGIYHNFAYKSDKVQQALTKAKLFCYDLKQFGNNDVSFIDILTKTVMLAIRNNQLSEEAKINTAKKYYNAISLASYLVDYENKSLTDKEFFAQTDYFLYKTKKEYCDRIDDAG